MRGIVTAVTRAQKKEHTREALLHAAAIEFERNGYAATVLSDISDSLGFTKGTVYFHFPTKSKLAASVIDRYFEAWPEIVEEAASFPSPYAGLVWLSEKVAAAYRDDVMIRAAMRLFRESALIDDDIHPPFVRWVATARRFLERGRADGEIRSDFDLDNVSWQIASSFFGNQQISHDLGQRDRLTERIAGMWEVYEPALLARRRGR